MKLVPSGVAAKGKLEGFTRQQAFDRGFCLGERDITVGLDGPDEGNRLESFFPSGEKEGAQGGLRLCEALSKVSPVSGGAGT